MKTYILFFNLLIISCFSWEGIDRRNGDYIEIERGNIIKPGHTIEVYRPYDDEYRLEEVVSASPYEVETYNHSTEEFHDYDST